MVSLKHLAVTALASGIALAQFPGEYVQGHSYECGTAKFTFTEISQTVSTARGLIASGSKWAGKGFGNEYPKNFAKGNMALPGDGPYNEFPLTAPKQWSANTFQGPHRVVFNANRPVAVLTHEGASGNQFVPCKML